MINLYGLRYKDGEYFNFSICSDDKKAFKFYDTIIEEQVASYEKDEDKKKAFEFYDFCSLYCIGFFDNDNKFNQIDRLVHSFIDSGYSQKIGGEDNE